MATEWNWLPVVAIKGISASAEPSRSKSPALDKLPPLQSSETLRSLSTGGGGWQLADIRRGILSHVFSRSATCMAGYQSYSRQQFATARLRSSTTCRMGRVLEDRRVSIPS